MDDNLFDDDFDFDTFDVSKVDAISAHEAKVDSQMRELLISKDPATRVEAARFLGNSGVPKAISALRKAYRNDSEKKVRKAAAYALGQFKALDQAIKRDPGQSVLDALGDARNADVVERLQNIATGEATGGGALSRVLRVLIGLSSLSLIVLVVLIVLPNLNLGGDGETEVTDSLQSEFTRYSGDQYVVVDSVALGLLEDLRSGLLQLRQSYATLNRQFNAAASGDEINCGLEVTEPMPIELAGDQQTYFLIGDIITDYTVGRAALTTVSATYDTVCSEQRQPSATEISRAQESLGIVQQRIDAIEEQIPEQLVTVYATVTPGPADAQPGATEEATAVVEATATELPGLTDTQQRAYIQQLISVISNVNGNDGANTILTSYWRDVQETGRTGGCGQPRPFIPPLDPVPQEVIDANEPELQTAWSQLHDGLDLLRAGWQLFEDACANNSVQAQASIGQSTVETATTLIRNANTALLSLR